jgi:hypothetical protein
MRYVFLPVVSALLVGMFACGESDTTGGGFGNGTSGSSSGESSSSSGVFAAGKDAAPDAPEGCSKMDIVFVVDDSGSMSEEQANLTANFPKFVTVLDATKTSNGMPLDYRVAVTTTGKSYKTKDPIFGLPINAKGDNGAFRKNCGGTKPWLEKSEASASFECRAKVGTNGPSAEMPLEAMKLALNERMADGTNAGFLRKDALLAIVFLTDEDDCSILTPEIPSAAEGECVASLNAEDPVKYVAMLDALTGDRKRWATAVIAGKTSCTSSFGSASEAKRMAAFVANAGASAVFSSICDGDLSGALKEAIDKFDNACRSLPAVPK